MAYQLHRGIHRLAKLASGIVERHALLVRNGLHHQAANVSNFSRVLTTSSMMRQDGHYINELPIVMCRAEPSMFPYLQPVSRVEKAESEQDVAFKLKLQQCSNVQEVFDLLEIPADTVSGYAATYALQRLCQLPNRLDGERQSFIRTAILNELCETVTKDIGALSNDTVITLTLCCSRLKNMTSVYVDEIVDEVEKRVGQAAFSIHELCTLIEIISNDPSANQSVANNIWIHIGERQKDIVADNIAHVYACAKYFGSDYKYMLRLVSRQLSLHWWKLTNQDVVTIANSLLKSSKDFSTLKHFGKWALMNIHAVTDTEMKAIIAMYMHFNYNDKYLRSALEKYVPAKINRMDITLIGMIQLYLRSQRYLSTVIMDAVAHHFTENGDSYEPFQILHTLKNFGELNYLPSSPVSYKLFQTIERVLYDKFSDFNVDQMLQILTSFVFVERFPINFAKRVFTPHFISKIKYLEDPAKDRATLNLQHLYTALVQETNRLPYTPYRGHKVGMVKTLRPLMVKRIISFNSVKSFLDRHIGEDYYLYSVRAGNTSHKIDFLVLLDKNKMALEWRKENEYIQNFQPFTKLAILIQLPEFYCVNSRHLLGEYAMRNRHLKLLGYHILELEYDSHAKISNRKRYMAEMIRSQIKGSQNQSKRSSLLIDDEDDVF